jgi:hypothetical protein
LTKKSIKKLGKKQTEKTGFGKVVSTTLKQVGTTVTACQTKRKWQWLPGFHKCE